MRRMSNIHPSALVGKTVKMGAGNIIGPHVIIEDGVTLGSHNRFHAGAYICTGTEIGDHNEIHMQAVVGHTPQDLAFKNEPSYTKIGSHNQIREFTSIHCGTKPGSSTIIGDHNFIMAYCHIAHNCELGNNIIMVNQASLTGYCVVEDRAFLSGMTGFHQFSRIGTLAMVSALSACNKDIPPYVICGGRPGVALGINMVGLRRAGFSPAVRQEIKQAYKLLYRAGLNTRQALVEIKRNSNSAEVQHFVKFIEDSKRGIIDVANHDTEEDEEETLKPRK
jgi:UDP-N-acetylglucosamine acyltransferase